MKHKVQQSKRRIQAINKQKQLSYYQKLNDKTKQINKETR